MTVRRWPGHPVRAAVLLACACGLISACAGDDDSGLVDTAAVPAPDPRGSVTIGVATRPGPIDPLLADSRSSRLLTRQIHEPLVDRISAPFGDPRGRTGIARRWRPSRDGLRWTFNLRRSVRFQDGTPFSARAVVANANRWLAAPRALELLPGLVAADAPTPDKARLFFSSPLPDAPERLGDPTLGIVSPEAIGSGPGGGRLTETAGTGTGPFEIRARTRSSIGLARNTDWWAAADGFGPGLDQIELRVITASARRAALLRSGSLAVADQIEDGDVDELAANPLVSVITGPAGTALGVSRAVRGIDSTRSGQSLADVWLTTLVP